MSPFLFSGKYLEIVIRVLLEIGSQNQALCLHYDPTNIAIIEHRPYLQMGLASRLIRPILGRAGGANVESKTQTLGEREPQTNNPRPEPEL